MEPVSFALGAIAFVGQAAHTIEFLRRTHENYGSNPAYLETIQGLADCLFEQLNTLETRFKLIAPSLTSLQLTCLGFHVQCLNGQLGLVPPSLARLHEAITRRGNAIMRANRIARRLEGLHDVLRDVEKGAQALHANLSSFEISDTNTAAVLDAVSRLTLLVLVLVSTGLIAAFVPGK